MQGRKNFILAIQHGRSDLADVVDQICDGVFEIRNWTLALEEVPHYCAAGSMPESLATLARMGRHRYVDLLYMGQRFAGLLPRRLTAATDYFVLLGQREPRDPDALPERVGREEAGQVEPLSLLGSVIFDVLGGHCTRGKTA